MRAREITSVEFRVHSKNGDYERSASCGTNKCCMMTNLCFDFYCWCQFKYYTHIEVQQIVKAVVRTVSQMKAVFLGQIKMDTPKFQRSFMRKIIIFCLRNRIGNVILNFTIRASKTVRINYKANCGFVVVVAFLLGKLFFIYLILFLKRKNFIFSSKEKTMFTWV